MIVDPNLSFALHEVNIFDLIDARYVDPGALGVCSIVLTTQWHYYTSQVLAVEALDSIWLQVIVDQKVTPLAEPISRWHRIFQVTHVAVLVNRSVAAITEHKRVFNDRTLGEKAGVTSTSVFRDSIRIYFLIVIGFTENGISHLQKIFTQLMILNLTILKQLPA